MGDRCSESDLGENMAAVLFRHQQHCWQPLAVKNWRQERLRESSDARVTTIKSQQEQKLTDSDKTRQWSDLGPIKTTHNLKTFIFSTIWLCYHSLGRLIEMILKLMFFTLVWSKILDQRAFFTNVVCQDLTFHFEHFMFLEPACH